MRHHDEPIQTIRLSPRDQRGLVDSINQQGQTAKHDHERRNIRVEFPATDVLIMLTQPNGMTVKYSVVTRNLSRWGVAFVHGQFVYPDTACELNLPTLDGSVQKVAGRVLRCRHVGGIVHEVSVMFEKPIELARFVHLSDEQNERDALERANEIVEENVECVETPIRRALIADAMRSDRKLFGLYLQELGLETIEATGGEHALRVVSLMHDSVDLILVDRHLTDRDGTELIRAMRGKQVGSAIIAVSADDSDAARTEMLEAGANAFLTKPAEPTALKQVVEQLLSLGGGGGEGEPIFSAHADNEQMKPIIKEFVAGLAQYVGRLQHANTGDDYAQLTAICQQLRGGGGGCGFDLITETAKGAIEALEAEQRDADRIRQAVNELLGILRRVRYE